MTKQNIKNILLASILFGMFILLYNLLSANGTFLSALPSLFEGTFMFILVSSTFVFVFKKDSFKRGIMFSSILAVVYALILSMNNWFYIQNFLIFLGIGFVSSLSSIKIVDYFIKY